MVPPAKGVLGAGVNQRYCFHHTHTPHTHTHTYIFLQGRIAVLGRTVNTSHNNKMIIIRK